MGGLSGRDAGGRGFGADEALGGTDSELVEAALGRGTLVLGGCDGAEEALPVGGGWGARDCPDFWLRPGAGVAEACPESGVLVAGSCGVAAAPGLC